MTIKDIAKESGYAVGTVSRVLNNHPDVSEQARKRILAVVEKTDISRMPMQKSEADGKPQHTGAGKGHKKRAVCCTGGEAAGTVE